MKKIKNLDDWQLGKNKPNDKRYANVSVELKYPDLKQFINLKPKERIKKINDDHKANLSSLIALNLFDEFEVTGTKKRPLGVKAKIKFHTLVILNKLDFINNVWIESIEDAKNIKQKDSPIEKYFCVKMTVVIEVEGISTKKQSIEKRFVLIKAKSDNEAYEKLGNQKNDYAELYLNSDGRFVRWRIESFDDCFETGIAGVDDLDNPEGVEIFSKLKSRNSNKQTVWDGKFI